MKIAVMQPYLFPYLGYYQLVNAVDKFIFFDDVNYIKKGWINKNNILLNNAAYKFAVPVKDASQNKLINQIELSDYVNWCDKFLRTIEMGYKKAPHFVVAFELISRILKQPYQTISDVAQKSVTEIAGYLNFKTIFETSGEIKYNTNAETGQEKVLEICKVKGANTYINPTNGRDMYNKEIFAQNNMELYFIQMHELRYKQFAPEIFVPFLSIIDVLMFNDKEQTNKFLQQYTLETNVIASNDKGE
jgi:hypothetical protein